MKYLSPPKEIFDPNAYLERIRNIKIGLRKRTKILIFLSNHTETIHKISQHTNMSYRAVLHHLTLLELEGIIRRKGKKPYVWVLTGRGQKKLLNFG